MPYSIPSPLKSHPKPLYRAEVIDRVQLTPAMIRIILGGEGLRNFEMIDATDAYVKLVFLNPEAPHFDIVDFDPKTTSVPRHLWPSTRTYTIRRWDNETKQATIDFVSHGDQGLAGPWATAARVGDTIHLRGPGGAYKPAPHADWHLLAGDDAALPAIHAAWETLPKDAVAHAFVEVPHAGDEVDIAERPGCTWTWLYRDQHRPGALWSQAVIDMHWPAGTPHCFIHGEATAVRDIRRYLRVQRSIPLSNLSISGYWRGGHTEDTWQSSKRAWNQEIDAEEKRTLATSDS